MRRTKFGELRAIQERTAALEKQQPLNSAGSAVKRSRSDGPQRDSLRRSIQEKLEKRITVSGYMGNSTKEARENHIKQFLGTLGTERNYGEINVFAKGVHGGDVIMEFSEREKAEQFIKEEMESIKTFEVPAKNGTTKKGYLQLYMHQGQWKVYYATRLLSKKFEDAAALKPHNIQGFKYKGSISLNDFEVVKIRNDDEKGLTYHLLKNNIEDASVEGLMGKLTTLVNEFKPTFE